MSAVQLRIQNAEKHRSFLDIFSQAKQLWWSRSRMAPDAARFQSVDADNASPSRAWVKPIGGGMWTSTAYQKQDGSWTSAWIDEQDMSSTDRTWLLTPEFDFTDASSVPYVIDDGVDLDDLIRCYPPPPSGETLAPYWPNVAKDWVCVVLTENGVKSSVASLERVPNLCGWDCESTLWFQFPRGSWEQLKDVHQ